MSSSLLAAGTALSRATSQGPFMRADTVSGLQPATNYTVFLAVRYQSQLIGTVVAISGVLTTDNTPPTFVAIGQVGPATRLVIGPHREKAQKTTRTTLLS